jgi:hypothetical protein
VDLVRAAIHASDQLRREPAESRKALAPFIGAQESTIERVWKQFTFPANLPDDLPAVLGKVELFVAAIQNRPAQSQAGLIAPKPLAEARR